MSLFGTLKEKYIDLYFEYLNDPLYCFFSDFETITIVKVEEHKDLENCESYCDFNDVTYTEVIKFNKFNPDVTFETDVETVYEDTVYKSIERAFYNDLLFCVSYTGTYLEWYETGEKKLQGNLFKGMKNGIWTTKHKNGNLFKRRDYVNNCLTRQVIYSENGKILSEENFNQEKKLNGICKKFVNDYEYYSVIYDDGKIVDTNCYNKFLEKCNNYEEICYGIVSGYALIILFKTPDELINLPSDFLERTITNIIPLAIFNKFDPGQTFTKALGFEVGKQSPLLLELKYYSDINPAFYFELTNNNFTGETKTYIGSFEMPNFVDVRDISEKINDGMISNATDDMLKTFGLENNVGIERFMKGLMRDLTEELNEQENNGVNKLNPLELAMKVSKGFVEKNNFNLSKEDNDALISGANKTGLDMSKLSMLFGNK